MSFVPPIDPWALGASLYTPATRSDLAELGNGKYPGLGSLIYCTEDAVREEDLPRALENLRGLAPQLELRRPGSPLRFIRPRSPEVLSALLEMNLSGITGFVLPKIHDGNLSSYMAVLDRAVQVNPEAPTTVLATLETREALSEHRMSLLRDLIFQEGWQERIGGLRIGGNDLMHALGLRRTPGQILYDGPLERVISMLLGVFKPYGFTLSSPVYEVFSDPETLRRELTRDLAYGLCGKTIIHPTQLPVVLESYQVDRAELDEAQAILDPTAPAVFQMNGRMCEPATHSRWANDIISRARWYGLRPHFP